MTPESERRERAIREAIRQIPRGKAATYGQVAAAAGYPRHSRLVVQILRKAGDSLPWQRVVGAGGRIRLPREAGQDQRLRLQIEGVKFRGMTVIFKDHQHVFPRRRVSAASARGSSSRSSRSSSAS